MEAKDLLRKDTVEYYNAANSQYTILGDYQNILNETGLRIYRDVLEKVQRGEFKGVLKNPTLNNERSGMWRRNPNHIARCMDDRDFHTILCSWNNRNLSGTMNGVNMTTSTIRFWNPHWIFTRSGSLYKLEYD